MRKGFADLLPRTVEDGSFRRPRSLDVTKPGDPDPAALDVEFFQSLDNDATIVASGLPDVVRPILHRRPAGRGRSRDSSHFTLQRKDRRDIGISASSHVGEITRAGLIVRRMTTVLRGNNDVELLLAHQLAHRFPASISLGQ